jgi:hypothetical protein
MRRTDYNDIGGAITSFCFVAPTSALFLSALCNRFDLNILLCLGAALWMEIEISIVSSIRSGIRTANDLVKDLQDDDSIRLTAWTAADYRLTPESLAAVRQKVEIYTKVSSPPPSQLTAYNASPIGRWIFLRDPPSIINRWGIFCLYHELGHTQLSNVAFSSVRIGGPIQLIIFVIICLAVTGANYTVLASLVLIALYYVYLDWTEWAATLAELAADRFALIHLGADCDIGYVSAMMRKWMNGTVGFDARIKQLDRIVSENEKVVSTNLPIFDRKAAFPAYVLIMFVSVFVRPERFAFPIAGVLFGIALVCRGLRKAFQPRLRSRWQEVNLSILMRR